MRPEGLSSGGTAAGPDNSLEIPAFRVVHGRESDPRVFPAAVLVPCNDTLAGDTDKSGILLHVEGAFHFLQFPQPAPLRKLDTDSSAVDIGQCCSPHHRIGGPRCCRIRKHISRGRSTLNYAFWLRELCRVIDGAARIDVSGTLRTERLVNDKNMSRPVAESVPDRLSSERTPLLSGIRGGIIIENRFSTPGLSDSTRLVTTNGLRHVMLDRGQGRALHRMRMYV